MERHQDPTVVAESAVAAAGTALEGEAPARQVVQVYRQVLIKDGEFVRPTPNEPAERGAAC
jgi:hypothetical protein